MEGAENDDEDVAEEEEEEDRVGVVLLESDPTPPRRTAREATAAGAIVFSSAGVGRCIRKCDGATRKVALRAKSSYVKLTLSKPRTKLVSNGWRAYLRRPAPSAVGCRKIPLWTITKGSKWPVQCRTV